jgi:hypothetical protein
MGVRERKEERCLAALSGPFGLESGLMVMRMIGAQWTGSREFSWAAPPRHCRSPIISKVIESERMTPVMWDANAFMLGRTLIEQIESFPFEFSGAVLLVTPDLRCRREGYEPFMAPVPNIIFEYGYLGA